MKCETQMTPFVDSTAILSKTPSRGEKTKFKEKETQRANQGRTGKSLTPLTLTHQSVANTTPLVEELTNPLKLPFPLPLLYSIKMICRFHRGLLRRCVKKVLLELIIKFLTVFASTRGSCGVWWDCAIWVQHKFRGKEVRCVVTTWTEEPGRLQSMGQRRVRQD